MPQFDQIAAKDDYSDQATLTDIWNSPGGAFSVAKNDAWMELQYGPKGQEEWAEAIHVQVGATGAFGALGAGTLGVRFKNFTAGKTATVSAYLAWEVEPVYLLQGSGLTAAGTAVVPSGLPLRPIAVADPGAGVSTIPVYTVPATVSGAQIFLLTYQTAWSSSGGIGDRAVLYEWLDATAAHFCYLLPSNSVYPVTSSPSLWLTTERLQGNYFRAVETGITEAPWSSGSGGLDFESGDAFGPVYWPSGWTLRIVVQHMNASDAVSGIKLLVLEVPA